MAEAIEEDFARLLSGVALLRRLNGRIHCSWTDEEEDDEQRVDGSTKGD